MELQTLKTIDVLTFDFENSPIKVSVPVEDGYIQAEKVYQALVVSLGLNSDSVSYFRLFEGLLAPVQGFSPDQSIPDNVKQLSLQKWCSDSAAEQQVCSKDEVAMKLMFFQTKAWVDHGWISATEVDKAQLEDYLDPAFPLPNQYIKLCRSLKGYNSYTFDKCTAVYTDIVSSSNSTVIDSEVPCSVILSLHAIDIISDKGTQSLQWQNLNIWQLIPATSDVNLQYADSAKALVVTNLKLHTVQCHFMVDVIKGVVTHLQKTSSDSPKFHVSMIKTLEDGSTRWENPLYKFRETSS